MLKLKVVLSDQRGITLQISGDLQNELDQFHLFQLTTLTFGEVRTADVAVLAGALKPTSFHEVQPGHIASVNIEFPMQSIVFPRPLSAGERTRIRTKSKIRNERRRRLTRVIRRRFWLNKLKRVLSFWKR